MGGTAHHMHHNPARPNEALCSLLKVSIMFWCNWNWWWPPFSEHHVYDLEWDRISDKHEAGAYLGFSQNQSQGELPPLVQQWDWPLSATMHTTKTTMRLPWSASISCITHEKMITSKQETGNMNVLEHLKNKPTSHESLALYKHHDCKPHHASVITA